MEKSGSLDGSEVVVEVEEAGIGGAIRLTNIGGAGGRSPFSGEE